MQNHVIEKCAFQLDSQCFSSCRVWLWPIPAGAEALAQAPAHAAAAESTRGVGAVQERDHGAGTGQRKEREYGNALGLPAAGLGNVHSDDVNGRCRVPGSSVCHKGFLLSRMSCCHFWAICHLFQFWSKSNAHSDYSYPKHLWYSGSLRFGSLKKTCELVCSGFGTALVLTASENAL